MKDVAKVVKLTNGYHGVQVFGKFLVPLVVEGRIGAPSMDEMQAIGFAKTWNDAASLFLKGEPCYESSSVATVTGKTKQQL